MKCFADTNVWFSAFYGSKNCAEIIDAYLKGKIELVICPRLLEELIRGVKEKAPGLLGKLRVFLEQNPLAMVRNVAGDKFEYLSLVGDEDDGELLGAAHQAGVKIFVTGNLKHFRVGDIKKELGVKVVSPAQLVASLKL